MTAGAMRPRRFAGVFTHRHTAENIWKAIAHATSMRTTVQEKVKDSAHPSSGGKAIIVHAPCWSEIQPSRASLRMRGLLWWRRFGRPWAHPDARFGALSAVLSDVVCVCCAALCIALA